MKCNIINGIFSGHHFIGSYSLDKTRIWDETSVGRSYPIENCEIL